MGIVTTVTLALGFLLSTVSGMICYLGSSAVSRVLSDIPSGHVILDHPETALAAGVLLVVVGILCTPTPQY